MMVLILVIILVLVLENTGSVNGVYFFQGAWFCKWNYFVHNLGLCKMVNIREKNGQIGVVFLVEVFNYGYTILQN